MKSDAYEKRRHELEKLSDGELYDLFWNLSEKIVDPLIELAEKNTSPSIERSVLLRMGFNSLEAKSIVEKGFERHLLGRGIGNVILKVAAETDTGYLEAGRQLAAGKNWDIADRLFKGVDC